MHPVIPYVIAAALFGVGVYGVLVRRNAILVLAAVELMLGAVNLLLVTADVAPLTGDTGHTGQSFALFVIVIAAAEIGVGLALVLHLYRLRGRIDTDGIDATPPDSPSPDDANTDSRCDDAAKDPPNVVRTGCPDGPDGSRAGARTVPSPGGTPGGLSADDTGGRP